MQQPERILLRRRAGSAVVRARPFALAGREVDLYGPLRRSSL